MIIIERIACYSQFPRGGVTRESTKLSQEAEGGGHSEPEPSLWFPQEEMDKAGQQV